MAGVIRRSADAIDVHAANLVRDAMEPERFATISALSRTLDAANSPMQRFEHMASLAGIGFTMALFIGGLAFPGTGLESQAKLGILLGSLVSAVVGISILLTTRRDVGGLPE